MSIKVSSVSLATMKGALGFSATYSCKFGNTRKARTDQVKLKTTEADPQLAASQEKKAQSRIQHKKVLIVSPEYDAIKSFYGATNKQIEGLTVPSFFRDGFRLATVAAVDPIETILRKAVDVELPALVAALVKVYPAQVAEAQSVLEPVGQWNAADYPTVEQLPALFSIGWNWVSFTVPEGLPPELRQKEQDKMERQFSEAAEQITQAVRAGFAKLIDHAVERLTVEPGEKSKTFRDTTLGNIQQFLDTFNARNLTQDAELAVLVAKAKEILLGVTPQKLRDYASVRENTLTKFGEINKALDGMLTERQGRLISFDDEPQQAEAAA